MNVWLCRDADGIRTVWNATGGDPVYDEDNGEWNEANGEGDSLIFDERVQGSEKFPFKGMFGVKLGRMKLMKMKCTFSLVMDIPKKVKQNES